MSNRIIKLTASLVAKYFPCQAKVRGGGIVNIDAIHKTYCHISDPDSVDAGMVIGYDELQLVLRPLEDLTEEDERELIFDFGLSKNFAEAIRNGSTRYQLQMKNAVEAIDYMRTSEYCDVKKVPYDCDNLIKQGLAVKP